MDLPALDVVLKPLGYGVLLPAALTAAGLLVAARPALAARGGHFLAVAAGLVAGFGALVLTGQIPSTFHKPSDPWDWLPGLGLLACALGVVDRLLCERMAASRFRVACVLLRWSARLAVGLLAGWLLVRAQETLEPLSHGWMAALAMGTTGLWALDFVARRSPGWALPTLLTLVAFAAAALFELCGFSRLTMMCGVLAGVLAACAVVSWLYPQAGVTRGAVPALAVLLPGLLFGNYFNDSSETPGLCHLLIIAAPLLLLATAIGPLAKLSRGRLTLLRAAVVILPLAAALTLAARS